MHFIEDDYMSIFDKISKDFANEAGALIGDDASKMARNATSRGIQGMDLFREVAEKKRNVAFDQAKGNLFEYIEAAKFNTEAAKQGSQLKAVVTDSIGRPHDAADIEIMKNGGVARQIQAKFSDSQNSAADSVFMQKRDKYIGMQRLIRKEENYVDKDTGEITSLLKKAKNLAQQRADGTGIYKEQYKDVAQNLTDELHHENISSGGTTLDEIREAYESPVEYANKFEKQQVKAEMKISAQNMAAASMVTSGIVSGITNMFSVFKNEKELAEALKDVGADVVQSGVRGGTTGVLGTVIRYQGLKRGSILLSDSAAATVMAGGVIDGGIALYSYARGEITSEQLSDELVDTTAKAATTIYYTKAITAILGTSVNPFIPMAVYTTASYVITCTREILRNAKLNTEEYARLTAILEESTKAAKAAHAEFKRHVAQCEERQRNMLNQFIESFEYNIDTGENYDKSLMTIVNFANQVGIALQNIDFDDFAQAMTSHKTFRLE